LTKSSKAGHACPVQQLGLHLLQSFHLLLLMRIRKLNDKRRPAALHQQSDKSSLRTHVLSQELTHSVASIWFEIWGSWIWVKNNFDFFRQISENFDFSGSFTQKIDFLQVNFLKILIFSGNFTKILIFHAKIGHLQLLLVKLFYFSSKVTTFEHTSCT